MKGIIVTSSPPSPKRRGNSLTIQQFNNRFGFTLIELIVTIAIISILVTFVVANVNSSLKRARDSERTNSLKQLQTALELYYQDKGEYPRTDSLTGNMWASARSGVSWIPGLTENYIKEMPVDPKNGSGCSTSTDGVKDGGSSCYDLGYYSADAICNLTGQGYILATRIEATNTTEFSQRTIIDPTTGQVCTAFPIWSDIAIPSLYVLVNP